MHAFGDTSFVENVATSCQGNVIPARELVFLPGKWDVFWEFPQRQIPRHEF